MCDVKNTQKLLTLSVSWPHDPARPWPSVDDEEDDDDEEVVMVLDAYGHATSRWALEWGFIEGMLMAESNVYCWG